MLCHMVGVLYRKINHILVNIEIMYVKSRCYANDSQCCLSPQNDEPSQISQSD